MPVALVDYAFVDLDRVKEWIGSIAAGDLTHDDLLSNLVNVVTDWMEGSLLKTMVMDRGEDIEEVFDGDGTNTLILTNVPVTEITGIEFLDEPSLSQTDCADVTQVRFDPDTGEVVLMERVFTRGHRNIAVSHTAGWEDVEDVPEVIKSLCCELVKRMYKLRSRATEDVDVVSRSGETVTYKAVDRVWSEEQRSRVQKYIRVRPIG